MTVQLGTVIARRLRRGSTLEMPSRAPDRPLYHRFRLPGM